MEKLQTDLKKPSYSIPEVARIFGITRYRVQIMIKLNQIPALLAGKQFIIMRDDIQNYLDKRNNFSKLQYIKTNC